MAENNVNRQPWPRPLTRLEIAIRDWHLRRDEWEAEEAKKLSDLVRRLIEDAPT